MKIFGALGHRFDYFIKSNKIGFQKVYRKKLLKLSVD